MPTYRPKPSVVVAELEGEAVLLDLDTRQYFSLNETGTRIWTCLSEGRTAADTAAALADEFEVTPEEAASHVEALTSALAAEGLVEAEA